MEFFYQYQGDMLAYVRKRLEPYDKTENPILKTTFSRFEHTMRVYKWMEKLYKAYPNNRHLDLEALSIATIFHDIGYCDIANIKDHARTSAMYCREYLLDRKYPLKKIDFICDMISRHSNKETLHDDIPEELVLLMEADLLDNSGAQGLVMDIWSECAKDKYTSFHAILEHMEKYTVKMMQDNPMRTEEGIRIWNMKRKLSEAFVQSYREDIDN